MREHRATIVAELVEPLQVRTPARAPNGRATVALTDACGRVIEANHTGAADADDRFRHLDGLRRNLSTEMAALRDVLGQRFHGPHATTFALPRQSSKALNRLRLVGHMLPGLIVGASACGLNDLFHAIAARPFAPAWLTMATLALLLTVTRADIDSLRALLSYDEHEASTSGVRILDTSRESTHRLGASFLAAAAFAAVGVIALSLIDIADIALGLGHSSSIGEAALACAVVWPLYYGEYHLTRLLMGETPRATTYHISTGAPWGDAPTPAAKLLQIRIDHGPPEPAVAIVINNASGSPAMYVIPRDLTSYWTAVDEASRLLDQIDNANRAAAHIASVEHATNHIDRLLQAPSES